MDDSCLLNPQWAHQVCIIVPAYNEEESIGYVIDELKESLPSASVVVVNDGSTDKTGEVARKKGVYVLDHSSNLGIGSTVQTGLKFAKRKKFKIAVQVDGDGQHHPADLLRLLSPIIREEADMVVGSRFLGNSVFLSSVTRRIGIFFFSCVLFLLTGKWISDPTSGFRAMNEPLIELFAERYPEDYPEPESLITVHRSGLRVSEISVSMKPRQAGISSISFTRAIYYMFKVSYAIMMEMFRTRKVEYKVTV